MKVKINDLNGKYYGTEVEIDDGKRSVHLTIWAEDTEYEPSERELKSWDNIEDFRRNCCDSHYESKQDYELALKIKRLLENE